MAHHPVTLDVLDLGFKLLEAGRGVIRDLISNLLLASCIQGHLMALLNQLACQVQTNESGAT